MTPEHESVGMGLLEIEEIERFGIEAHQLAAIHGDEQRRGTGRIGNDGVTRERKQRTRDLGAVRVDPAHHRHRSVVAGAERTPGVPIGPQGTAAAIGGVGLIAGNQEHRRSRPCRGRPGRSRPPYRRGSDAARRDATPIEGSAHAPMVVARPPSRFWSPCCRRRDCVVSRCPTPPASPGRRPLHHP